MQVNPLDVKKGTTMVIFVDNVSFSINKYEIFILMKALKNVSFNYINGNFVILMNLMNIKLQWQ
jgi:ABC-type oligopeptide transport system ATPase subunit